MHPRAFLLPALLGLLILISGCGSSETPPAPTAPASQSQSSGHRGGIVSAEPSRGLLAPALRADASKGQTSSGKTKPLGFSRLPKPKQRGNGVSGEESCPDYNLDPAADNLERIEQATLCLLNLERAQNGLGPYTVSAQLTEAAVGMAKLMVAERFFAHTTPEGKSLTDRIGPTGYMPANGDWTVGENLAWGSGSLATPVQIVAGWMNSPAHRANILDRDYREIGIGLELGAPSTQMEGGLTYVTNFGVHNTHQQPKTSLPQAPSQSHAPATSRHSKQTATSSTKTAAKAKKKLRSRKHKRRRRRHH